MIYVFGQEDCMTCIVTKNLLQTKNIVFEYYDIGTVYEDKDLMKLRHTLKKQATKEQGKDYTLPLISKGETLITLEEAIIGSKNE